MIRNQPPKEVAAMNPVSRDFALDPQDLARLLVSRANAGDVEGMVALYEPDAALACGDGRIAVGTDAIRKFYTDLLASGRTFDLGEQRPAMLRFQITSVSPSRSMSRKSSSVPVYRRARRRPSGR